MECPKDCMCDECAHKPEEDVITVQPWKQYEPGISLMHQDHYHMMTMLGKNVAVLHANHSGDLCHYLIIVDTMTGQSKRISFTEKGEVESGVEKIMVGIGNIHPK